MTYIAHCRICYNKARRNKRIVDQEFKERTNIKNKENYYKHKEARIKAVVEYRKTVHKSKLKEWGEKCRLKAIQEFIDYKSKLKCSKCDESHISCLEFHHLDPSKKEGLISKMRSSRKKLKIELEKCIVLCSNCHRKLHYEEKNNINN